MKWFRKIIRSIFTKLLLVIVLTGICINLVVGGFFWLHRSAVGRPLHKNIQQYLTYIIDDLGTPPDFNRARQIGEQASLQISFESPGLSWTTADNLYDIKKAPFVPCERGKGVKLIDFNRKKWDYASI